MQGYGYDVKRPWDSKLNRGAGYKRLGGWQSDPSTFNVEGFDSQKEGVPGDEDEDDSDVIYEDETGGDQAAQEAALYNFYKSLNEPEEVSVYDKLRHETATFEQSKTVQLLGGQGTCSVSDGDKGFLWNARRDAKDGQKRDNLTKLAYWLSIEKRRSQKAKAENAARVAKVASQAGD